MLRYLGHGYRDFGLKPTRPSTRINWEFFAVVEGRCAPWHGGQDKPRLDELRRSTFWVFPPEAVHSWTGEKRRCRVVVFHFATVPPVLADAVRHHGYLQRTLSPVSARRIAAVAGELKPHYDNPTQLSPLHVQKAEIELVLLALADTAMPPLRTLTHLPQQRIAVALAYFQEHLAERPSLSTVAKAAGVSPSHLRRLLAQAQHESPRLALRRVALERAVELLSHTDLTLDIVAEQCGFAGASEFSRAFKRHFKVPPAVWRRGVLPPYQMPVRVGGRMRLLQDRDPVVQKLRHYGALA